MTTSRPLADLLPPSLHGLEHLGTDEPPATGVGHGLSALDGPVDTSGAPHLWTEPTLPPIPGATVMRWQPRPSTIVIESAGATALVGDPVELDPGVLQIDAHDARFVLLFPGDGGDVILDVAPGGRMDCYRVERAYDVEPRGLTLPPVDLEQLGALDLEPWLVDAAAGKGAQGEGPAIAVGLVLRLGRPSGAAQADEIARLRAGEEPTVVVWARSWLEGVAEDARTELEARVREATTRALVALDDLGALLADGDDAGALAVEIVERRDDAESVRRLLALVGDAEHLATVCGSLDRRALEVGAALADALVDCGLDPDWLDAVSWQEPDAWWALVGDA